MESSSSARPETFVREATGLVRSMSWVDLLYLNVVSFGGAWSIIYALTYAPFYGGDPAFSLLLTAPGILALLGIYYVFTTSMPRSGGDYVFMSRILHPSIGLAANFIGYGMFLWFWIADSASVFSSQGLAQTLSVYGSLTGQKWATTGAGWFVIPWNNFALGTVVLLSFAAVVIFRTRLYFWIQNVFMTVAVIGLVIIAGLLLSAAINPSVFVANYNHYVTSIGANTSQVSYGALSASAASSVPDTSVGNVGANLAAVPLWFTVLFWVYVSTYLGGETKNARTTVKRAMFGGFGIIFLATLVILEAAYKGLGLPFLYGANNAYYSGGTAFGGVLPQLTLFSAILSNNAVLVLFLGVGIIAGFLLVAPQSMLLMSRILFAYSWDGVTPKGLADVSDRFHTPTKAILVALVGAEVMLAFLSGILGGTTSSTAFTLYTYAGLGTITLTFTFVSLSAILFPFRRKQLFELASTVKTKVAGVPAITWLGLIALVYSLGTIGAYTYYNTFYTFGCYSGNFVGCDYYNFLGLLAALFVAAILFYFAVRAYRSRSGIPFDLAFKEIPPE